MKRSTERILVGHGGTLPRPADLQEMVAAGDARLGEFERRLPSAVQEVVDRQIAVGMDQVNDGEYVKRSGFGGYVRERLAGITARQVAQGEGASANRTGARDKLEFPKFHELNRNNTQVNGSFARGPGGVGFFPPPSGAPPVRQIVTGPITFVGKEAIAADVARLKIALGGKDVEGVIACLGVGTLGASLTNEYYKDEIAFFDGVADAMHDEYKAVTDAGFIVQIDEPEIGRAWQFFPSMTPAEYRKYTDLRIQALNRALRGVPAEQVRLHWCWGSGHRPHKNDAPLEMFLDVALQANVGVFTYEASNVVHAWEWVVWKKVKLPAGKSIMPGVIGHAEDHIEHPELVAQRLEQFASVVGRENVMAGTDCGIGSRVGNDEICWAKLRSMAEGARIASKRLWGG